MDCEVVGSIVCPVVTETIDSSSLLLDGETERLTNALKEGEPVTEGVGAIGWDIPVVGCVESTMGSSAEGNEKMDGMSVDENEGFMEIPSKG